MQGPIRSNAVDWTEKSQRMNHASLPRKSGRAPPLRLPTQIELDMSWGMDHFRMDLVSFRTITPSARPAANTNCWKGKSR